MLIAALGLSNKELGLLSSKEKDILDKYKQKESWD